MKTDTVIVLPNYLAQIYGVKWVTIYSSGNVQLAYLNGSFRSAYLTYHELKAEVLELIAIVESKRGPVLKV